MRNISHGARCARILGRIGDLIAPGIEYENGRQQRQCVAIGPVGNRFYRVECRDGRYYAAKQAVKPGKLEDGTPRCFTNREEGFDTFEDALSRAVRWFAQELQSEKVSVDFAISYAAYLEDVRRCEIELGEKKVPELKERLSELKRLEEGLKQECAKTQRRTDALKNQVAYWTNEFGHAKSLLNKEAAYKAHIASLDRKLEDLKWQIKAKESQVAGMKRQLKKLEEKDNEDGDNSRRDVAGEDHEEP